MTSLIQSLFAIEAKFGTKIWYVYPKCHSSWLPIEKLYFRCIHHYDNEMETCFFFFFFFLKEGREYELEERAEIQDIFINGPKSEPDIMTIFVLRKAQWYTMGDQ